MGNSLKKLDSDHTCSITREVVNIVKHLEQFPNDGLANVVRNVFDFDSYNKETRDTLDTVLQKHGM